MWQLSAGGLTGLVCIDEQLCARGSVAHLLDLAQGLDGFVDCHEYSRLERTQCTAGTIETLSGASHKL